MHRSPFVRRALLSAILALPCVIDACSTSSSPAAPTYPPALTIVSLWPAGGNKVPSNGTAPLCVEVGQDADRTIVVGVDLKRTEDPLSWLTPPLSCTGSPPPCGFLVLTVDACSSTDACPDPTGHHDVELIAVGQNISVQMAEHVDGSLTPRTGLYRFRVEARDSDGQLAKDAKGRAISDEVLVDVRASCGDASTTIPLPDAGPDSGVARMDAAARSDAGARPDATTLPPSDASAHPDAPSILPDTGSFTPPDATPRPDAGVALDAGSLISDATIFGG